MNFSERRVEKMKYRKIYRFENIKYNNSKLEFIKTLIVPATISEVSSIK
jgi:hypothetical protein